MMAEPGQGSRIKYSKVEQGALVFVIADVRPDGAAEFFSQEAGEVRWYPFVPVKEEQVAALALLRARPSSREPGWPLLFAGDGGE